MAIATAGRRYLAEFLVVFFGVALAFAVENLREDLNDRAIERDFLAGFAQDFAADREYLTGKLQEWEVQFDGAQTALEFYEGRSLDVDVFFHAFYNALSDVVFAPRRNTMGEVLNSGSLRLIRDPATRSEILGIYARYDRIVDVDEHMNRDFDAYLYDTSFALVPFTVIQSEWRDIEEAEVGAQRLLTNLAIQNGLRLAVHNLEEVLLPELHQVMTDIEELLETLLAPEGG